jgi:hypothetical protein
MQSLYLLYLNKKILENLWLFKQRKNHDEVPEVDSHEEGDEVQVVEDTDDLQEVDIIEDSFILFI